MKLRRTALILFFLPPLIFGSGCATRALWDNGGLEACREPANPANLHLFESKQKNDLLVVYDEYSERSDKIKTRAYWLNENRTQSDQNRAPHFVNTSLIHDLPSIPVFHSVPRETNELLAFYAVIATNQQSFKLYYDNREIGSHSLPIYNDGRGKFEKTALTPVAVTADLTIVGCLLGYWYLEASGGNTWPVSH
ncbi:MAG: hypothetical protein WDM80_01010 [Limisphaerales bacterium]